MYLSYRLVCTLVSGVIFGATLETLSIPPPVISELSVTPEITGAQLDSRLDLILRVPNRFCTLISRWLVSLRFGFSKYLFLHAS
jgi:hypothetical protein